MLAKWGQRPIKCWHCLKTTCLTTVRHVDNRDTVSAIFLYYYQSYWPLTDPSVNFLLFLIRCTAYSTVQPYIDTFGPGELHTTSSDDLNRTWFIDELSLVEQGGVRTKEAKTRGTRLDPLWMDRKALTEGETSSIAAILTSRIPPHLFCGCFWCSAGEFRGNRGERGLFRGKPRRRLSCWAWLVAASVSGWIMFGVRVRAD